MKLRSDVNANLNSTRIRKLTQFAILVWASLVGVSAQDAVQIRTNYFAVRGDTARELRRSINLSRPRSEFIPRDALTTWRIEWKSSVERSNGGCRLSAFTTCTTIVISLPSWAAATNASPDLVKAWKEYFAALVKHEWGHVELALPVAGEIRQSAKEVAPRSDCDEYRRVITEQSRVILRELEQKQKNYDRNTRHGVTQGAFWPPWNPVRR